MCANKRNFQRQKYIQVTLKEMNIAFETVWRLISSFFKRLTFPRVFVFVRIVCIFSTKCQKSMVLPSTPWTWFYLNRFEKDDTCYNFTSENSISVLTIQVIIRVIRISNIDKIFQRSCVRLIYQVVVSVDIRSWSYECIDISLIFQGNFELTINIGVFAILRSLPFGMLDTGIY